VPRLSIIKHIVSWRAIAALTALFTAAQIWLTGPLFTPVNNSWTLIENLAGKRPAHHAVSAYAVGVSPDGVIVGTGQPGWAQWNFSAPGPLPSVIQPFFIPHPSASSGIYLIAGGKRVALAENTIIRNRPINFRKEAEGLSAFQIRFEGEMALLSGVKFRQPAAPDISHKALVPLLFLLLLVLLRARALGEKETAILAALTAAGLAFRWLSLCAHWHIPLEGDSSGYWQLARSLDLSSPFGTGNREPAFVWLLRLGGLLGDSERSARFVSLILSCALIPMTWRLSRRLGMTAMAGLIAAAMAAFNPFYIFMASQSLRMELFTLLILYFSGSWLAGRRTDTAIAGALLILTRIQAAAAVFPLAIAAAVRDRAGLAGAARRLLLPALALASVMYAARMNTGSFTGNLDPGARYFAAAEREGDPARITEYNHVTLGRYLFSDGAAHRLAFKTIDGYLQIILNPFDPFNRIFLNSRDTAYWNLPFLPFFWGGLWLFLSGAGRRDFLLLPLFFLSALPALHSEYREPRLLFHVAPFFHVICAAGIAYAAAKTRWLDERTPPPGASRSGQ